MQSNDNVTVTAVENGQLLIHPGLEQHVYLSKQTTLGREQHCLTAPVPSYLMELEATYGVE
jgi:hypothetical protein